MGWNSSLCTYANLCFARGGTVDMAGAWSPFLFLFVSFFFFCEFCKSFVAIDLFSIGVSFVPLCHQPKQYQVGFTLTLEAPFFFRASLVRRGGGRREACALDKRGRRARLGAAARAHASPSIPAIRGGYGKTRASSLVQPGVPSVPLELPRRTGVCNGV